MNSKEVVEKLNSFVREYPDVKIIVNVDNDLCDDEYATSFGSINRITISNTWDKDGEYVYVDDEIEEEIAYDVENDPENEHKSEDEIDQLIDDTFEAKLASGEIKKEIIIWVN